jgi:hypothetical protein
MKYPHQPHKPAHLLIPLLAVSALAANVANAQSTVFLDTFSQPGAPIVGSTADIGGTWTGSGTANTTWDISAGGTADTSGNGRLVFDNFTASLGAGEVLTLSYDTALQSNGAGLNGGWAGVSLYTGGSGGTEQMFLGEVTSYDWGKDGSAIGGQQFGTDNTMANHLTITYAYDTGAWTFTSDNSTLSGIGTAGLALDELRIGNGGGADINLDNLTVTIVPEPASLALLGIGGLGLVLYRRGRS